MLMASHFRGAAGRTTLNLSHPIDDPHNLDAVREQPVENKPPLEAKVEPAVRSCRVDLARDVLCGSRVDSFLNPLTVATRREWSAVNDSDLEEDFFQVILSKRRPNRASHLFALFCFGHTLFDAF